jgi:hypothetical protein
MSRGEFLCQIELDSIDETPAPIFARLQRPHNGMVRRAVMSGGVLVLGGVATTDMATLQA